MADPSSLFTRPGRRLLAIAFPHLEAEMRLRREGASNLDLPFAIVGAEKNALCLVSVNPAAAAAGLAPGQKLADARAVCPALLTRPAQPERHEAMLGALARWAERFSPLVGTDQDDTLVIDISGCAHLFGGEAALCKRVAMDCAELGLTTRIGLADTRGGAWALAHAAPGIAPAGATRRALEDLPVGALRIDPATVEGLGALGLGTIGALARIARGQLARRFGVATLKRLDQALGVEPEPVSPDRARPHFAARLSLPEPIGLTKDVMAGLERLLERVCTALTREHQGARRLRLIARRVDNQDQSAEIRLAQPGRDPMRLRALFERKVAEMDAGFGIEALRLIALETEPLKPAQTGRESESDRLADLLSRLGNRIGFEHVTRFLPNESHIPERAFTIAAAAWSEPQSLAAGLPRPLTLFPPERLARHESSALPRRFRWRGEVLSTAKAVGPERIAPEWWWDDPAWRSGPREYWRIETAEGPRLWLYRSFRPRTEWWVHGVFA
ncbi:DNA polymerase Y family protein [Rhodobacteraceae bacterium NNCM2]|nr:DNA polymerase Y family protein [Coraliihabitans acroporae]